MSKLRLKHHLVSTRVDPKPLSTKYVCKPVNICVSHEKNLQLRQWRGWTWVHRCPGSGCSLPQWSIIHLTNWRLGQIYEFSKLNQNKACSDLQKVTQLYWIFVSILWPKIKWVTIRDRFRNLPVDSWQLWVSVLGQRAQVGFPFPEHRLSAQGPEVPVGKLVPCNQHSAAHGPRNRFRRTTLAPPQHTGSTLKLTEVRERSAESARKWTHPLAIRTPVTWVVTQITNLAWLSSLSPFPAQQQRSLFFTNLFFI